MVRKPKGKVLTREEAIEAARIRLAPLWRGSPPILLGMRSPTGATVYPIDPDFVKKRWILALIDPLQFRSPDFLSDVRELYRRYQPLGVETLLILSTNYAYFRDPGALDRFAKENQVDFGIGIDPDGAIFESFGAVKPPKAIFVSGGKILAEGSDYPWLKPFESAVQKHLREEDPGLALFKESYRDPPDCVDTQAIDFSGDTRASGLELIGEWKQNETSVSTIDPKASLHFDFEGTELAIVAKTIDLTGVAAEVVIEVNGAPLRTESWGTALTRVEGGAGCWVIAPGAYRVITGLAAGRGRIRLRFPLSARAGIALYGARFGKRT